MAVNLSFLLFSKQKWQQNQTMNSTKDSQLHKEDLVSILSETFRPTFPDVEFSNLFLLVILAFFLNFNLLSIASILRDRN